MSDRYHCINGVWTHDDRCGEGRDFTADEVVSVYAEHDPKYNIDHVTVLLKDGTEIVPDYTGWGTREDAIREAESWYHSIFDLGEKPSTIKAIETFYKGYRFRSRLEARWAVFFDVIGAEWEYEPEGYDLGNGVWYLPDFLIRNHKGRGGSSIWVEVKGIMTPDDEEKIIRFANCDPDYGTPENSIYIVGNIPKCLTFTDLINDLPMYGSGRVPYYNFKYIDDDYFGAIPCATVDGFEICGDDNNYLWDVDEEKTMAAFNAARQARFEHGEHGYTNNNN